jgi:hypothetical protein
LQRYFQLDPAVDPAAADVVLEAACKNQARNQFYQVAHTSRSQFSIAKTGVPIPKHDNVRSATTMSAEEYDEVSKSSDATLF